MSRLNHLHTAEYNTHKTKILELESKRNTFFEENAKGYCIRSRAKWLEER